MPSNGLYPRDAGRVRLVRGDTFVWETPEDTIMAGATKLWCAIKADHIDTDTQAKVLITLANGLEVLNGAVAGTPANGKIEQDTPSANIQKVTLEAVEAAMLTSTTGLWYLDFQQENNSEILTVFTAILVPPPDVTRATT